MSVEIPETREEMIDHCFMLLGEPVVKVNVTRDQARAKIRYGIKKFIEYHYEGTDQAWIRVPITDSVSINKKIQLPEFVVGVQKLLNYKTNNYNFSSNSVYTSMWSILSRNLFSEVTSASKLDIYLYERELSEWETLFNNVPAWSFNTVTKEMQIDGSQSRMPVGGEFMIKVFVDLSMITGRFWMNPFLIRYCEALIREQWGNNLIKFPEIGLPGGMRVSGDRILSKAEQDIAKLEEEMFENASAAQSFILIG